MWDSNWLGLTKRDATPVHPETDRDQPGRVSHRQADMTEMGHERLAGFEDLVRLRVHVEGQSHIAAQFISQDVERGLEDSRDGRGHPAFPAQTPDVRPEGVEIGEHRHRAFDQGNIVSVGYRITHLAGFRGNSRKPGGVKEGGRIINQRVVFIFAHKRLVFRRLDVIEAAGVRQADARNAVVAQANRLG